MDIKDTLIGIVMVLSGIYYLLPRLGVAFSNEILNIALPFALIIGGGYLFFVSFSTTITEDKG